LPPHDLDDGWSSVIVHHHTVETRENNLEFVNAREQNKKKLKKTKWNSNLVRKQLEKDLARIRSSLTSFKLKYFESYRSY
jgi:hypothetical protein